MTSRAKPITSGVVARTSTVNAAVRSPYTRRQNTNIMTTRAAALSAEGRRAVVSLRPKAPNERATARK